jgi:hypothetical protein
LQNSGRLHRLNHGGDLEKALPLDLAVFILTNSTLTHAKFRLVLWKANGKAISASLEAGPRTSGESRALAQIATVQND